MEVVEAIKKKEELRLKAYRCPAGVWTIGYGHTGGVLPGDVVDEAEADRLLVEDLTIAADAVRRLVRVPLAEHELGALVSFTMNVGTKAFANSTLRRKLNAGDRAGAANEFERWDKATDPKTQEKVVLAGLTTRRKWERNLFLGEA